MRAGALVVLVGLLACSSFLIATSDAAGAVRWPASAQVSTGIETPGNPFAIASCDAHALLFIQRSANGSVSTSSIGASHADAVGSGSTYTVPSGPYPAPPATAMDHNASGAFAFATHEADISIRVAGLSARCDANAATVNTSSDEGTACADTDGDCDCLSGSAEPNETCRAMWSDVYGRASVGEISLKADTASLHATDLSLAAQALASPIIDRAYAACVEAQGVAEAPDAGTTSTPGVCAPPALASAPGGDPRIAVTQGERLAPFVDPTTGDVVYETALLHVQTTNADGSGNDIYVGLLRLAVSPSPIRFAETYVTATPVCCGASD
ncbi:MAG: hypothetical protein ACYDDF_02935 [Thermoplasmatota archaeon]